VTAKFPLGQILITSNAVDTVPPEEVRKSLARHAAGDWGDVDEHDRKENEMSLREGYRLLSVYHAGDQRFWIITEADRSATTVLLPEDY